MKSLVIVSLVIAIVSSQSLLEEQKAADQSTQDFAVGFFLALRAAEKCPHAFECVSTVGPFQQAVTDVVALIQSRSSVQDLIKAVTILTNAFQDALPGCESLAGEGAAYIMEIKSLTLTPSFPLQAAMHLFKYRTTVAQDLKDYNQAKVEGEWLVAGMKLGEIGRIIIWGNTASDE